MSLPTNAHVYTGVWINWSRGRVLGSTLTLTQRSGSLLTAFLGIFVTTAGVSCWRIFSFYLHQRRVRLGLQDAVHHQEQVILRNGSTPGLAAWQMFLVTWNWRRISKRPVWRSLVLVILALCHLSLFAAAGVLSGEVAKAAGNETLIRSARCGFNFADVNKSAAYDFDTTTDLNAMLANVSIAATNYARSCYTSQPGLECYQYPTLSVPIQSRRDVACPFSDNICKTSAAYEMDTGFMDSHVMFGINSKPVDRLELRKVTTCSVLRTESRWRYSSSVGPNNMNMSTIRYYYGSLGSAPHNYTFEHLRGSRGSYTLDAYLWTPESNVTEALYRPDADGAILFLAQNSVLYEEPVYDPWFSATVPQTTPAGPDVNFTLYAPDDEVSVFACMDQFQLRNPHSGNTTSLNSFQPVWDEGSQLNLTYVQLMTFYELEWAILNGALTSNAARVGAQTLSASRALLESNSARSGLPSNQWKIEAENLFAIQLATLQQSMVNYAAGPERDYRGLIFKPGATAICTRQKFLGVSGFLSFSTLGLSIIIGVGTLLILIPFVLDSSVGNLRRRFDWDDHKRLQWAVDEKLQLQRMAFESAGQGHRWIGGTETVPTTAEDEGRTFGLGSAPNAIHPRLARNGYVRVTGEVYEPYTTIKVTSPSESSSTLNADRIVHDGRHRSVSPMSTPGDRGRGWTSPSQPTTTTKYFRLGNEDRKPSVEFF